MKLKVELAVSTAHDKNNHEKYNEGDSTAIG